jgi:hypothetical protein
MKPATRALLHIAIAMTITLPGWSAELIVVNPATTETAIGVDVLRSLYSGRKKSLPDGEHVEILVLDGPVHEHFVTGMLDSSPNQFTTYWQRLVFIGQGKLPRSFASEKDELAYIAAHPGTIGYIDANTPHDGVKVLVISE